MIPTRPFKIGDVVTDTPTGHVGIVTIVNHENFKGAVGVFRISPTQLEYVPLELCEHLEPFFEGQLAFKAPKGSFEELGLVVSDKVRFDNVQQLCEELSLPDDHPVFLKELFNV